MSRKHISITIIALGLFAVALAVVFLGGAGEKTPLDASGNVVTRGDIAENALSDIVVPGEDTPVPENIAQPESVTPAIKGSSMSLRIFDIAAKNGEFTPNTIVVNQGDIIRIAVSALDKPYDVVQPDYGKSVSVAKGKTAMLDFGATAAGKFMFYCSQCGGPQKGPVGYIVVVPPNSN